MSLISLFSSVFKPIGNSFKEIVNNIPNNDFTYNIIPNNDLTFTLVPDNDLFKTFILDNDVTYVLIPNNDIFYSIIPNNDGTYALIPNNDLTYTILIPTPTVTPTPTIIPTSSSTPTPTPTISLTPTLTPIMSTLNIDIIPGTTNITFDGVIYTTDTTISVIKNQQYIINTDISYGGFLYWNGTNVYLPAGNSNYTVVTITGDTATLQAVFNTPTPSITPTATITPTPSSTPTPFVPEPILIATGYTGYNEACTNYYNNNLITIWSPTNTLEYNGHIYMDSGFTMPYTANQYIVNNGDAYGINLYYSDGQIQDVNLSYCQPPTPTPTVTITPTSSGIPTFKSWSITTCGNDCTSGVCACNDPSTITVYTIPSVSNLTAGGVTVYSDSLLTTPWNGYYYDENEQVWLFTNGVTNFSNMCQNGVDPCI